MDAMEKCAWLHGEYALMLEGTTVGGIILEWRVIIRALACGWIASYAESGYSIRGSSTESGLSCNESKKACP